MLAHGLGQVRLSVGEVAAVAGVAPRLVQLWCDRGWLKHYRLPSASGSPQPGDRRVLLSDLILFATEKKLVLPFASTFVWCGDPASPIAAGLAKAAAPLPLVAPASPVALGGVLRMQVIAAIVFDANAWGVPRVCDAVASLDPLLNPDWRPRVLVLPGDADMPHSAWFAEHGAKLLDSDATLETIVTAIGLTSPGALLVPAALQVPTKGVAVVSA